MKLINRISLVIPILTFTLCFADSLLLKLPYLVGESYKVTRGYSDATHVNRDLYALDFALRGCDVFDRPVLAAADGIVVRAEDWHRPGEIRSYGNIVGIEHPNNIFSIYTHLNTVKVKKDDVVKQGQHIGTIGNTGSCEGTACPEHPGAHLHFAMYKKEKYINAQGREEEKYVAYKPEPMSGFVNFTAGKYYKSDNELYTGYKLTAVGGAGKSGNSTPVFNIVADNNGYSGLTIIESNGKISDIKNTSLEIFKIDSRGNIAWTTPSVKNSADREKEMEISFEKKYNARLLYEECQAGEKDGFGDLIVGPGQEIAMRAVYKNTGIIEWNKNVSLNITNSSMGIFYNNWLTRKRPALVSQNIVRAEENGDFFFKIKVPQAEGRYSFELRPVIFLDGDFEWLGADKVLWQLRVKARDASLAEGYSKDSSDSLGKTPANSEGTGGMLEEGGDEPFFREGPNEKDGQFYGSGELGNPSGGPDIPYLETYLSDFPKERSNASEVSFSFYSDYDGARFQCRIGGEDFEECTSPATYGNLSDGSYIFEVRAVLGEIKDATPARHNFSIDRQALEKISNLKAISRVGREAVLSGSIVGEREDAAKFMVFYEKEGNHNVDIKDWRMIDILSCDTEFEGSDFEINLDNLERGVRYYFSVQTVDIAGNISELSNSASVIVSDASDHLLISELKPRGEDSFIELYNPTLSDIELNAYYLQISDDRNNIIFEKEFEDEDRIGPNGFFLIAGAGSVYGAAADKILANISFDGAFRLRIFRAGKGIAETDEDVMIDEIEWGGALEFNASLERKAHQSSTSELMLAVPHKYDGNGFDSDDRDDFLVRQEPQPQNSASFREPHQSQKPTINVPAWNGNEYFKGEEIKLAVDVSDFEDGEIRPENLLWFLDGEFKTSGKEFLISDPALGRHNIGVKSIDSDGEESIEIFYIKIVQNGWKDAVKVPGGVSSQFDAFLDPEGIAHLVFVAESSVYGEDDYGNSLYYQKTDGNFLAEPVEIIKLDDFGIGPVHGLDFLVDEYGVIHIVFTGSVRYENGNYKTYYLSSRDNFKSGFNVYSGFIDAKIQAAGDRIYVASTDGRDSISFKQLSVNGPVQILKADYYDIENSLGRLSYDFAIRDGKVCFNVLYYKNNSEIAPVQFGEGFPASFAIIVPDYNMALGRIENTEGAWSFDLLEEKDSSQARFFSDDDIDYIVRQNYSFGKVELFARQGSVWYRKKLSADADALAGFGKSSGGRIRIVSYAGINRQRIFWHFEDEERFRKIKLYGEGDEDIAIENLIYLTNKNGKEVMFFSVCLRENMSEEIIYLEN